MCVCVHLSPTSKDGVYVLYFVLTIYAAKTLLNNGRSATLPGLVPMSIFFWYWIPMSIFSWYWIPMYIEKYLGLNSFVNFLVLNSYVNRKLYKRWIPLYVQLHWLSTIFKTRKQGKTPLLFVLRSMYVGSHVSWSVSRFVSRSVSLLVGLLVGLLVRQLIVGRSVGWCVGRKFKTGK